VELLFSWCSPAIKSLNGYEAMAIRSRGAAGKCKAGLELAAMAVFKPGNNTAMAVVAAELTIKCLRVDCGKAQPV
jgi:hypothetical protein